MLSYFQTTKAFYDTKLRLFVDCEAKTASLVVTYKGRITETYEGHAVTHDFSEVATPAAAENFLSRKVGREGSEESLIEFLHRMHLLRETEKRGKAPTMSRMAGSPLVHGVSNGNG